MPTKFTNLREGVSLAATFAEQLLTAQALANSAVLEYTLHEVVSDPEIRS